MVGWYQSLKYQPNFLSLNSFSATLLYLYPPFTAEVPSSPFLPLRRNNRGCLICRVFKPDESTREFSQPYSGLSIPSTSWPYRRPITPVGSLTAFEDDSLLKVRYPLEPVTPVLFCLLQPVHSLTKDLAQQFHFRVYTSAATKDPKLYQLKAHKIIQVNLNSLTR